MANEEIHIGHLIEQKVDEIGLSIDDFAKLLHCHRTNVYKI